MHICLLLIRSMLYEFLGIYYDLCAIKSNVSYRMVFVQYQHTAGLVHGAIFWPTNMSVPSLKAQRIRNYVNSGQILGLVGWWSCSPELELVHPSWWTSHIDEQPWPNAPWTEDAIIKNRLLVAHMKFIRTIAYFCTTCRNGRWTQSHLDVSCGILYGDCNCTF